MLTAYDQDILLPLAQGTISDDDDLDTKVFEEDLPGEEADDDEDEEDEEIES